MSRHTRLLATTTAAAAVGYTGLQWLGRTYGATSRSSPAAAPTASSPTT